MSSEREDKLKRARALAEAGNNDEARYCLLEILKQNANDQAALMMLGGSYFLDNKYPEAEMVFERLILMAPGAGSVSIALFNTLWKSGRREEALEEIKRFLTVADKDKEQATIDQYMQITNSIADDLDQNKPDQYTGKDAGTNKDFGDNTE